MTWPGRTTRSAGAALAAFLAGPRLVAAQAPYLVKDINVHSPGSRVGEISALGATALLAADDGVSGSELWRSDGTPGGTSRVADICPGASGSSPHELTPSAGVLFFAAADGSGDVELWLSDGTAPGTRRIQDLCPGCSSSPRLLTDVSGVLFFLADDGASEGALWKSDGTPAGTVLVRDLCPGAGPCPYGPAGLAASGGRLFFVASQGGATALWSSDGTPSGTQPVTPASVTSVDPPTPFGSGVSFRACDDQAGCELWLSDGTAAGTALLKDIVPGFGDGLNGNSSRTQLAVGGTLYFAAQDLAGGVELWLSDGTAGGTVLVRDIVAGTGSSDPFPLAAAGGTLFFLVHRYSDPAELWRSDGTALGTWRLTDIACPFSCSFSDDFAAVQGNLFFAGNDGIRGAEPWRSDGTNGGTALVADLAPGSAGSSPRRLTAVGGTMFFLASDGVAGEQLWKSDGTPGGTVTVAVIDTSANQGSDPSGLVAAGGALYFTAEETVASRQLWKSDGTPGGTAMVRDLGPLARPLPLAAAGGLVFFSADDPTTGREPWRSDGTAAGTIPLGDINPGPSGAGIASPAASGGRLFFAADQSPAGGELWRSDGTIAGTALVADLNPTGDSFPRRLTDVGGRLFFDTSLPRALFRSDGTASGTVEVVPPSSTSLPAVLGVAGDSLLFIRTTFSPPAPDELWRTDGTPAGTALASVGITPAGGEHVKAQAGRSLFFVAFDADYSLWQSDGTGPGTRIVQEPAYPWVARAGDLVYFFDGTTLVASDGTTTAAIRDLGLPLPSWEPTEHAAVGRELFFLMGRGGGKLWRSDGTGAGTFEVPPPPSGPLSGFQGLTALGGHLYFSAHDETHGRELWALDTGVPERALLRNQDLTRLDPPTPALATLLPLVPGRDDYLRPFVAGDLDPDAAVIPDRQRPLVLYALDGTETLYLAKSPLGLIRVSF